MVVCYLHALELEGGGRDDKVEVGYVVSSRPAWDTYIRPCLKKKGQGKEEEKEEEGSGRRKERGRKGKEGKGRGPCDIPASFCNVKVPR